MTIFRLLNLNKIIYGFTETQIHLWFLIFTLKNVRKINDLEKPRRARARKVVNPPLNTAVPIVRRANRDLSSRDPTKNATGVRGLCLWVSIIGVIFS